MAGAGGAPILLAAGGTGGHLFSPQALAAALNARGIAVALATDVRATRYGDAFPAERVHVIPSATMRGRDPVSVAELEYVFTRDNPLYAHLQAALE